VATSHGYFPKWQLPKCAISQAATSQVCPSRSALPPAQPILWEIENLGSCRLGNCHLGSRHWENAFGKVPNTFIHT